ncbi:20623_t:CDS:1 [Dentiscutata erythropus]|uniref:20623_t:CDS:1 n=1 Tax=Dentiscutata erythropus TaxID=1348616 RepID=A0A9N8VMF2_9GLOM|nr:20623_t:CDS:1 [Dentiscutata erythropus]
MSKPNLNRFTLVTSTIKLGGNNELLQKSLELDIHRNDPEEGQVEEFLRLFYDDFTKILFKEEKLVIDLVRSRYKWFGLGGQAPDKKSAKEILESIDVTDKLITDKAKETKRKAQLILAFLLTEEADTIESNKLIEALENLHTREVVTLEKQKEFIRYLTRSSDNGSPIAPMVLGYAYREGKFGLEKDSDKGKEYLECASERGNEKATEMLDSTTSKRNAQLYNIVKEE